MEVDEKLGVDPAQCDTAILRRKGAVVDVCRSPEVTSRWHIAKLRYPRGAPEVVPLFGTVIVGDVI